MTLPALVTFDLDSTICDTGHRHHLIDREKGTDWNAYSLACVDDTPVLGVVALVRLLSMVPGIELHGLSARNAVAKPETVAWLLKHDVPLKDVWLDDGVSVDYHVGYTHADYKLERLRQVEAKLGLKCVLHVDDYASVAHTFNEAGVPCVGVRTPQEILEMVAEGTVRNLA